MPDGLSKPIASYTLDAALGVSTMNIVDGFATSIVGQRAISSARRLWLYVFRR